MFSLWFWTTHQVLWLPVVWILYSLIKYTFRITLHPLARFPGPPLARVTRLYAAWIDCTTATSVVKLLPEWHKRYGPIVRVQPDEIHIHDWNAFCQVFKANTKFDKDPALYSNPGVHGSFFNIPATKDAKPLRDLFLPHFSKAKVDKLEPLIHEKLGEFLEKLESTEGSLELDTAYAALTGDTVMHWTFQESFGLIDAPGFRHKMLLDLQDVSNINPPLWYFPTVLGLLVGVIRSLLASTKLKYFPAVAAIGAIVESCRVRVVELAAKSKDDREVRDSIFATALDPKEDKGQQDLTTHQLTGHAMLMYFAGTGTTSNTLTFGTWHILGNAAILARLRKELDDAMPDARKLYKQADLERLPYLRGVVKESLRFSLGASARLTRVAPAEGATFAGQYIPPGTRVSFSNYVYNFDPEVFEDPFVFKPERWLAGDSQELETKMISFSRGSRACIGINVAYAELYNAIAHIFRRFDLKLDGTTEHDMAWRDCYVPRRNGHLRVRLRWR